MVETITRRSKRHPPMPVVPEGGACRWCAIPILFPEHHKKAGQPNPRRRWCSEATSPCVQNHLIASHQGDLRKVLWKRDRGLCGGCGRQCGRKDWDADHRIPLWSVPEDVTLMERSSYWSLDNAQTLCGACHKAKCADEAKQRAARRKALKGA